MYKRLDWTLDNRTYKNLPKIVEDLHNHAQHYVMLVVGAFWFRLAILVTDSGSGKPPAVFLERGCPLATT
jgi:hypothetical protein